MNTSLKGLNELAESEICQVSGGAAGDALFGFEDFSTGALTLASGTVVSAATATQPLVDGASGTLNSVTNLLNSVTKPVIP